MRDFWYILTLLAQFCLRRSQLYGNVASSFQKIAYAVSLKCHCTDGMPLRPLANGQIVSYTTNSHCWTHDIIQLAFIFMLLFPG